MKCPKCNSIIPDDSKFCPDCGAEITNIESLRKCAKDLSTKYSKGYEFFVNNGSIPHYSEYLSIEGYQLIISKSPEIIRTQKEFDDQERKARDRENERKKENQRALIKEQAYKIAILNKDGYNILVKNGTLPKFSERLSNEEYELIVKNKYTICQEQRKITDIKRIEQEKKDEQKLRDDTLEIINTYDKGYDYFVTKGIIEKGTIKSLQYCKKILAYKDAIKSKNRELLNLDKDNNVQNRSKLYSSANSLVNQYPEGYNYYVSSGSLPQLSKSLTEAELSRIISWENLLSKKDQELKSSLKVQPSGSGDSTGEQTPNESTQTKQEEPSILNVLLYILIYIIAAIFIIILNLYRFY